MSNLCPDPYKGLLRLNSAVLFIVLLTLGVNASDPPGWPSGAGSIPVITVSEDSESQNRPVTRSMSRVDTVLSSDKSKPGGSAGIDINTADFQTLKTLPGVNADLAVAFLRWREINGPFSMWKDVMSVDGMTQDIFLRIRPLIWITDKKIDLWDASGQELIRGDYPRNPDGSLKSMEGGIRININTAELEELVKLPGIGSVIGNRIIEYRRTEGLFEDIRDIMKVRGIGEVLFDRLKNFIII